MKRTIGYLRVSTDGQAEHGYGLDVQRERVEAYAKAMGFAIDEFIVDDGYTGTTFDRPGLRRLIDMCDAGDVAKVIVYRLDRLSRKQRGILEVIEDVFEKNDVAFVSVSEQFDTSTPFGRAALGMMAVFAQLDRDVVVERLRNGKASKAASGDRAVGDVPYGYRVVDGKTLIDAETAPVVKRIFACRRGGLSMDAIANGLNEDGVPTPKGGKRWYGSTIKTILDNPIYRGSVEQVVGGVPIVSTNENLALL